MRDFISAVEAILRKANSETSVRDTKLAVINETLDSLVLKIKEKGIKASVTKGKEVTPIWEVSVDKFNFIIDGLNIITTADNLNKDLVQLVTDDFLDSLEEEVGK